MKLWKTTAAAVAALVVGLGLTGAPAWAAAESATPAARMRLPNPGAVFRLLPGDVATIYSQGFAPDVGVLATALVLVGTLAVQDQEVTEAVKTMSKPDALFPVMQGLTMLGDGRTLVLLAVGMSFFDQDLGRALLDNLAVTAAGVQLTKIALGRERPGVGSGRGQFTGPAVDSAHFSMPSGHTAAAFAVARVLAEKYPEYKWYFYTLAGLVGLSRIYLGLHWPSDVVAGALLGWKSGDSTIAATPALFHVRW